MEIPDLKGKTSRYAKHCMRHFVTNLNGAENSILFLFPNISIKIISVSH
jgi:hypothetical protein